ncbi:chemotaxis protein CheW [Perlabentimonas gracilis]|uniref:chemotaxis protein CheW n=1 Tax=Perlabentimonas gracilis TaxID=2715279 RepID=UPI00140E30A8|nr:chemotaxis protein CheW [Perlabentimonas gracilis]NHB69078.1 chemotaxis protein CheW [Perlabentimonas gracilis]
MSNEKDTKINSYLSFKLGDEEFAAHASKVLNILELSKITVVPQAPEYMKGVINLRGTVLPVIDTRIKFGMSPTEYTTNTCIIVMDIVVDNESVKLGALVDAVQAVLEIEPSQIMPAPSIGSRYRSEFIDGVTSINDRFVMILDMDAIFSSDDLTSLVETTTQGSLKQSVEEIA